MLNVLDQELQTYEEKKNELLARARGKFVLIKEDRIEDIFDTETDAIRQGYERFGNEPFLVKEIVEVEIPVQFASNLLGV